MKTTKLFLIPAILVALTFASCSDYDNGFTVNQIKYDKAFIDAFGNIDPNQDWNLVKQLEEKNGRSTRGTEPGAVDNPGNYPDLYQPNTFSYNQLEIVRLFFQNNKYLEGITYPWDEFFAQQIYTGNTKCGTQYGSASDCKETYEAADGSLCTPSQMNEFHVKSASGDYHFHIDSYNNGRYDRGKDGGMYVTDADASSFGYNNSAMGYIAGNAIIIDGETIDKWAKGEGASILKKLGIPFESVAYSISKTPSGEELPMKRYFLGFDFSLLDGDDAYNGNSITIKGVQYRCLKDQKNHYAGDLIKINNFGSVKDIYEKITDFDKEAPTYTQYYEDLKKLKYCIENGYSPVGQNGDWVKLGTTRNGYYSDWIMAITPGTYSHGTPDYEPDPEPDPEPTEEIIEAGLLCCEDLGGEEADFDFNDIVLKLEQKRRTSVENGKEEVKDYFVITAMAAGGTLPSYVFYKSLKNADEIQDRFYYSDWTPFGEVDGENGIHGMMGGDLEPINVGGEFVGEGESHEYEVTDAINILRAYTNENAEVQEKIRLYADHYVSYVFDRARIRIYVNAQSPTDTIGRPYIEPIYHGIEDDEETSSFRAANTPQMMLLPLRFEWPTEATFIGTAYPNFGNWVREKENTDWYLNKEDDSYVTSRKVVEEELQPFLRWKDNDDIYLSITIKEGETIDLFCTSLNHNNPSVSDNASSDIASAGNIYYITNELNNHEFGIKLTGLKAGNTTIVLTQDANEKYRAESITLNVTVESNPKEKSTNDLHWTSSTSLNMTAGGNAQSVSYKTSSTGTLSVKSSNENVAVAKMGNNNTITVTPKSAGTATITLSQTEDANYKSGSIYFSVTVEENKPAGGYVDISNYIPQKNVQETNVPQEMFSELKTKITIKVQTEAFSDYCDLRLYCKHPTNGWTDFVNYERIPSDTTKTWTFTDSKIIDTIKNHGGLYIGGNNPYHVKKIEILCE